MLEYIRYSYIHTPPDNMQYMKQRRKAKGEILYARFFLFLLIECIFRISLRCSDELLVSCHLYKVFTAVYQIKPHTELRFNR